MEITFDREKLLGSGGYGAVYECVWKNDEFPSKEFNEYMLKDNKKKPCDS